MSNGNLFRSLEGFRACCDVVNCMKNVCAVVPASANVANTYGDILKDYKPVLMFERLAFYLLGANRSFAVFAPVVIHSFYPSDSFTS